LGLQPGAAISRGFARENLYKFNADGKRVE